jgi:preprotein translocase subunit SecB
MAKNNEPGVNNAAKFRLGGLYVKDISFENPLAPAIFTRAAERPEMSVGIDVNLKKLKDKTYEVSLKITARADEKGKAVFLVELVYGGLFVINPALPLEEHDKILLVDCAQVIFPFARRLVADLVQEGNFPALLLEPINFEAIYQQKRGKAA